MEKSFCSADVEKATGQQPHEPKNGSTWLWPKFARQTTPATEAMNRGMSLRFQIHTGTVLQRFSSLCQIHAGGVGRFCAHWSCACGMPESWEALACAPWALQVCMMLSQCQCQCQCQCCVQCDWNQQELWCWVDTGRNVTGMKNFVPTE